MPTRNDRPQHNQVDEMHAGMGWYFQDILGNSFEDANLGSRQLTSQPPQDFQQEGKLIEYFLREQLPKLIPQLFDEHSGIRLFGNQGAINETFIATGIDRNDYILKVSQSNGWFNRNAEEHAEWSKYHKEQHCLEIVSHRESLRTIAPTMPYIVYLLPEGLPEELWKIQGVAPHAPYAMSVQTKLPGVQLSDIVGTLSEEERNSIIKEIGRLTREIHSTVIAGVGWDFDAATSRFTSAKNSDEALRFAIEHIRWENLLADHVLDEAQKDRLLKRFEEFSSRLHTPCLTHDDIHFGNVLVDPETKSITGIIDWECCNSRPSFHFELSRRLYEKLYESIETPLERRIWSTGGYSAFLEGYGYTVHEYEQELKRDVETVLMLNLLAAVGQYSEDERNSRNEKCERPRQREKIERLQLGKQKVLDHQILSLLLAQERTESES